MCGTISQCKKFLWYILIPGRNVFVQLMIFINQSIKVKFSTMIKKVRLAVKYSRTHTPWEQKNRKNLV